MLLSPVCRFFKRVELKEGGCLEHCRNCCRNFSRQGVVWVTLPMRRPTIVKLPKVLSTRFAGFGVDSVVECSVRLHDESIDVALGGNFVQLAWHVESHVAGVGRQTRLV